MSLAARSATAALPATRAPLYLALNAAFVVLVTVFSVAGPADNPRALYLCLLMALCSSPLLWLRRFNGRFVLLGIFLAAYFVFYGASDIGTLTGEASNTTAQGFLSAPEFAILLGAGPRDPGVSHRSRDYRAAGIHRPLRAIGRRTSSSWQEWRCGR